MNPKQFDREAFEQTAEWPSEPKMPCRPRSLSYHYEHNSDSLTLHQKKTRAAIFSQGCFLTLWLTGWTAGCVMLIWLNITQPAFFTFCFAVPFWVGWFVASGTLMAIVFGKITVKLDCDGLYYTYHILLRLNSRQVPLDEIRYCHAIQDENDDTISYYVVALTYGKSVHFAMTNIEEAQWFASEMNQTLASLKGVSQMEMLPDVAETGKEHNGTGSEKSDEPISIPLNSKPQDIEPPVDSRWKLNTDFDSVTLTKRGEFSLAALGATTFIMLFWDGIVSVFVMLLWGIAPGGPKFLSGEWWFLFVFLIPFEVIGVGFFLAWLFCLIAPFQQICWNFARNTTTCCVQWLGIGCRRCYSLENCDRMVIDTHEPGGHVGTQIRQQINRKAGAYQLKFIDRQNEEVFSFDDLTLGEAHWVANVILEYT